MYNNDLVGKDKPWGPQADLLPWQRGVYSRYYDMVKRCEDPNREGYQNYGAKGVKVKFTSLSHYYETLKKDPLWKDFKKDPHKYAVDKDINGGGEYSPATIKIVLKGDNVSERNVRRNEDTLGKWVVGLYDGKYHEWPSCPAAARATGGSASTIQQTCNGFQMQHGTKVSVPHTKVGGKLKGWTFYWLEDYQSIFLCNNNSI